MSSLKDYYSKNNSQTFHAGKSKITALSRDYTSGCFYKAIENLDIDSTNLQERELRKAEIDAEYIRLVRTLPEWMLNDIISDHVDMSVIRIESTIQEILDELALRIMLK